MLKKIYKYFIIYIYSILYANDKNILKKFFSSILNSSINSSEAIAKFFDSLKRSNIDDVWINYIVKSKRYHKWHLVSPSPWPFFSSLSVLILVMGFVLWMNKIPSTPYPYMPSLFTCGFVLIILVMTAWFTDIIKEGLLGYHTTSVLKNLRMGFILFIVSEVMFFFSFFWAYFHFSIDPSIWGGDIWPPDGIVYFWLCENVIYSKVDTGILNECFYNSFFFTKPHKPWFTPYCDFTEWKLFTATEPLLLEYNKKFNLFFHFSNISKNWKNLDHTWIYADYLDNIIEKNVALGLNTVSKSDLLYAKPGYLPRHRKWWYPDDFVDSFITELNNYSSFFTSKTKEFLKVSDKEISSTLRYHPKTINMYKNFNLHFNFYDRGLLINPFKIPLLNTCILLTSGAWLTLSHIKLKKGEYLESLIFLLVTIIFAVLFVLLQFSEYLKSGFSINDTVYGGIFYMLTGFHGFHVLIGTIFLLVCLVRMHFAHFTPGNHFGFEAAIWYWHFVDVVWVFLYLFVYLWPGFYFYVNHFDASFKDDDFSPLFKNILKNNITIGINVDYMLQEYPNSVFNYHKAWNIHVKNKIISQIANSSYAIEKMKGLQLNKIVNIDKLNDLDNAVKLKRWNQFLYNLEFKFNKIIKWHEIFNIKDEKRGRLYRYFNGEKLVSQPRDIGNTKIITSSKLYSRMR